MIEIDVQREPWADPDVALPRYHSDGAAGADIRANFPSTDRVNGVTLAPGERIIIPTGLRLALPHGYEMQLRPRSGLALKHGLTLLNSPGTIDCDYRGAIGVLMINLGQDRVCIRHGDRIAQAVIAPVHRAQFQLIARLPQTARGTGGFGSTGQQ